jgi:hypothetical protein
MGGQTLPGGGLQHRQLGVVRTSREPCRTSGEEAIGARYKQVESGYRRQQLPADHCQREDEHRAEKVERSLDG